MTISRGEVEALRQITGDMRMDRVNAIARDAIQPEEGTDSSLAEAL